MKSLDYSYDTGLVYMTGGESHSVRYMRATFFIS